MSFGDLYHKNFLIHHYLVDIVTEGLILINLISSLSARLSLMRAIVRAIMRALDHNFDMLGLTLVCTILMMVDIQTVERDCIK